MENKQVYLYFCLWSFKEKFIYTLELIIHTMFKVAHFLF